MKKEFVISVGCEYGCFGPEIGKMIAKDYGIAYYDRKLIDEIIEEAGFSKDLAEKAEAGLDVRGKTKELSGGPTKYANLTERVVYIQTEVIKKLAARGSCVFIGRCSDYILRDHKNCLNVFIYAPMEVRIKNVMEGHNLSREDAVLLIEQNDEMLHARYKQMTGTYRGDRHNRHLLIDSNLLGLEGTVKLIEEVADRVFGREE
ncbi:MAG: cytidylate kinase-like family protein [Lachnospiraceae bacterium]|nr:cytidylate kinase-like family protein [Robinsoniella sp.]MDY3765823.1 cytidylate kinase-like family protein [Lachnospiraceae bacterium]